MWKQVSVSEKNPITPIMQSSFATRFPEQREPYIRANFGKLKSLLSKHGIAATVDFRQCTLSVSTTPKTWDAYCIVKARAVIRRLARYVPLEQAGKVLCDGVYSDIVELGKTSAARNQVRFIRRRARLIGPNGVTLRAIELLCKCYVLVYGRTVAAIGEHSGVRLVRRLALDCMNNVHPIYQLKRLMVQQELEAAAQLSQQSWERFLPSFKRLKRNSNAQGRTKKGTALTLNQIKKKANAKKTRHSKRYTPWPPAPVPSKIDLALEDSSYWNKAWRKENLKRQTAEQKLIKEKATWRERSVAKNKMLKHKFKTAQDQKGHALDRTGREGRAGADQEAQSGACE